MEKVNLNTDGKAINKSTTKSSNLMMNWLKPNIKSGVKGTMRRLGAPLLEVASLTLSKIACYFNIHFVF